MIYAIVEQYERENFFCQALLAMRKPMLKKLLAFRPAAALCKEVGMTVNANIT